MSRKAITSEDLKSFSRAACDTVLSIASGTAFALRIVDDMEHLLGSEAYKNPKEFQYGALAFFAVLSLADGYVHFRMYNHARYNKVKTPVLTPATAELGTLLINEKQAHKHEDDHEDEHEHGHKHKPKQNLSSFSFPAFLCALSCSVDTTSAPIVVLSLFRGIGLLGRISKAQRVVEVVGSAVTGALSLWNASRLYSMAKEHLESPGKKCC
ncbi:MAG: hypothetical protein COB66_00265 [Coxiella sp. (in: Bacteria)]|nr:MAG: hypothetical protein COB66_00265 [Coxiella sp. (in: g-proteobacteria)]